MKKLILIFCIFFNFYLFSQNSSTTTTTTIKKNIEPKDFIVIKKGEVYTASQDMILMTATTFSFIVESYEKLNNENVLFEKRIEELEKEKEEIVLVYDSKIRLLTDKINILTNYIDSNEKYIEVLKNRIDKELTKDLNFYKNGFYTTLSISIGSSLLLGGLIGLSAYYFHLTNFR